MSKLTELLSGLDEWRADKDGDSSTYFSISTDEYDLLRTALREGEKDKVRLNLLETTLHIDATGDEPIYALFVPGSEGVRSKSDLRGLLDESLAMKEAK